MKVKNKKRLIIFSTLYIVGYLYFCILYIKIIISIKNRNNKSFQQIKQETENKYSLLLPQALPFKEIEVDNEQAFIIPGYEFVLDIVVVAHEGYIYEISRIYSEKDVPEELFNQMLSTFKFLE